MSYQIPLAQMAGQGTTTGVQTVVLSSTPVPLLGKLVKLEARVVGRDSGGDVVHFVKHALVRNNSNVVSIVGSVLDAVAAIVELSLTGVSATFVVSGSNIELRATGVLSKTITWTSQTDVRMA